MNADKYQELASRTLIDEGIEKGLLWNALGLCGESGEIADRIKKGILHEHGVDFEKLREELGDCLWYLSALVTKINVPLSEVMEGNIEKLKSRYPNGYSHEDSRLRVDVK